MSYKASLIKTAIKWTPKKPIIWIINFQLKNIAEISHFEFDLDSKKVYAQTQLFGEEGTIDVWVEDFGILHENDSYTFIIREARSNRPWMSNLLAKFVGKAWTIPVIPQLAPHMTLIAEVLQANNTPSESK